MTPESHFNDAPAHSHSDVDADAKHCMKEDRLPFLLEPPMGLCLSILEAGDSGRGSNVAGVHVDHSSTFHCTPAFRALLRVAALLFHGQVDGSVD